MYHYLACFQSLGWKKTASHHEITSMLRRTCWRLTPESGWYNDIKHHMHVGGGRRKQRWGHAKSHQNTKHMKSMLMCVCHCLIIFTSLLFHSFFKHRHMCTSILCSKTPTSRWVAKRAVSLCSSIQLQDVTSHVVRATFGTKWNFLLPGAPFGMFK